MPRKMSKTEAMLLEEAKKNNGRVGYAGKREADAVIKLYRRGLADYECGDCYHFIRLRDGYMRKRYRNGVIYLRASALQAAMYEAIEARAALAKAGAGGEG